MTPCTTLEQRWSACRGSVAQVMWQPMKLYPFFGEARRPCTSPRRHQCRNGAAGWFHRWVIDWERCEELPW